MGRSFVNGEKLVFNLKFVLADCGFRIFLISLVLFADRNPLFLENFPEGFFDTHEELAARKCHWSRHFTRERIDRALRVLHGVSCSSSSSSSDQRASFLREMQGVKMSIREKKAAEKKAAEEKRTLEAIFRPLTPPEATGGNEPSGRSEATDKPEGSGVDLVVTAAPPEVPEAGGSSVVIGLLAGGQAKSKEKRPRGERSGDKRKRSRKESTTSRPIYKDAIASANLIASCAWPLLPAPESLVEADKYGETSANFLKVNVRQVHFKTYLFSRS